MDIHHLKIFFEACNEKSFTKAARKLYISQSAVSIQIKKLESTLGLQLIERNSKNFRKIRHKFVLRFKYYLLYKKILLS